MRVTVLLLVLLAVLGAPATSHAEKVRTNAKAKVYNRPGEQGKIVVKVKEGQAMTVLAKEGRWLKVRVSGRTGFIPRSKVDMPDDEITRNTRRRPFVDGRSTKRTFGGDAPDDRIAEDAIDNEGGDDEGDGGEDEEGDDEEPRKPTKASKGGDDEEEGGDDEESDEEAEDEPSTEEEVEDDRKRARVAEKTTVYNEPNKKSGKLFTASPNDTLYIESEKGKWTEVSIEEGDIGWIQTSQLETDDDEGGGGKRKGRNIDIRARAGVRLMSQQLSSAGGAAVWPDRYKIASSAAAVSLGGQVTFPYKKDFLLGGMLSYDLAYAMPGISFDPDGANGPMPGGETRFTMHLVKVLGVAGYDFKKKSGLVAYGRLGVHYESFMVANNTDLNKNTARLPSEVIKGPSLGVAVAVPRITDKIGLDFALDTVMFGAGVTQTKNLEDGANPTATRVTARAALTYRYSPAIDISVGYDLNYASMAFGAPIATSQRMHTGTAVARKDLNHTVSGGIQKSF